MRRCRKEADRLGIHGPMPVLQGWELYDYLRCLDLIEPVPPLVGLGSVCRRRLRGPDGLAAVIERLDRELPAGVRLHGFGVKSRAVRELAGHPRLHSVDRLAWDFAARYSHAGSNTVEHRIRCMRRWYERQVESLPQSAHGNSPAKDPDAKWR